MQICKFHFVLFSVCPSGQWSQHEHCSVADSDNRAATIITVAIGVTGTITVTVKMKVTIMNQICSVFCPPCKLYDWKCL